MIATFAALVATTALTHTRGTLLDVRALNSSGDVTPAARGDGMTSAASPGREFGLVVIGTSLTARYTWPEQVANQISQRTTRHVNLARFARGGATSNWVPDLLESPAMTTALSKADVVLIEFLANDSDIRRGLTIAKSRHNHQLLIDAVRRVAATDRTRPAPRIILMTMNPASGLRAVARLRSPAFNAMYRELSQANGVEMLDLDQRWKAANADQRRFPDGLHPSDEQAHSIVTPAIAQFLFGP